MEEGEGGDMGLHEGTKGDDEMKCVHLTINVSLRSEIQNEKN